MESMERFYPVLLSEHAAAYLARWTVRCPCADQNCANTAVAKPKKCAARLASRDRFQANQLETGLKVDSLLKIKTLSSGPECVLRE